jgi:hypothetical protein
LNFFFTKTAKVLKTAKTCQKKPWGAKLKAFSFLVTIEKQLPRATPGEVRNLPDVQPSTLRSYFFMVF